MDQNAVGALQVPRAHQPKAHMDVWTPELPQCQNTSELSQRCPARLTCTLHQEGEALSGESFTHSRGYSEQRPLPANQHSLKGTQHVLQRQALGSSSVFTCTSSTTHPLCLCCITHLFNTVSPLPHQSLLLWAFNSRCQHWLPTKSAHSETNVELSSSFRCWSPVAC